MTFRRRGILMLSFAPARASPLYHIRPAATGMRGMPRSLVMMPTRPGERGRCTMMAAGMTEHTGANGGKVEPPAARRPWPPSAVMAATLGGALALLVLIVTAAVLFYLVQEARQEGQPEGVRVAITAPAA